MCPLVRRGRAIARGEGVLTGWMYLVGCAYNFCWEHDSLRVAAPAGRAAQVAGADSGDGGRADGPSVDDARVVEPADPPAALGRPQAARAAAEAISGLRAGHGMTTVPWGATVRKVGYFLRSSLAIRLRLRAPE